MSDDLIVLGYRKVGSRDINLERRLLLNPTKRKLSRLIEPSNPWRWKTIYRIYTPRSTIVYPIDMLGGFKVNYLA